MTKKKPKGTGRYRVANPRDIPPGHHILRVGDQFYYEGDEWDEPLNERFVKQGFLVEITDGEG